MNNYNTKTTLIFGEVLIDRFDSGNRNIGGAPFNVAYHLRRFGRDPVFISAVGNDSDGKCIMEMMKNNNIDTSLIQVNQHVPTGVSEITTDRGEPEFNIHPDRAYDFIDHIPVLNKLAEKPVNIIYHGSLALRNISNKKLLEKIINFKKPEIFFDVNLRYPWWNKYTLKKFLRYANFVKINLNELKIISDIFKIHNNAPVDSANKMKTLFNIDSLCVTNGDKGGFFLDNNGLIHYDAHITNNFRNSVGAGDAFCSVIILGMINNCKTSDTLNAAAEFAAYICSQNSAVAENHDAYSEFTKKWEFFQMI